MAKGLTCGYLPFGCLMVSDKIATKYDDNMLALGLTGSAHPVSCAAALETLKIYEDDGLLENAATMGKYVQMKKYFSNKTSFHWQFQDDYYWGCIELVKNRDTKEPMAPFNAKSDEMTVMNKVAAK